MIEKVKKETTLPIVKSAHVLMRADARKRCRFAPKNAFIPRTGAGIAHGNVPPDDNESRKGKESPYWYSDIIFLEENAPQTICQGAYLHKNFAARTPY